MPKKKKKTESDVILRPHSYEGIQEYDRRLPNWWLWTLYGAIAFSLAYWCYYEWPTPKSSALRLEEHLAEIATNAAKNSKEPLTNAQFWTLSMDPGVIGSGKATYQANCASCHNDDLSGKIGPNLKDNVWIYGGEPIALAKIVNEGVLAKGMPAWASVLGRKQIDEVVAYVMSFHSPEKSDGNPPTAAP